MIGFPVPYQNELIYSTIARAGVHEGETSPKQLLDSVFSNRKVIATVDLPSHVQCISDQYPASLGFVADVLIYKHTLWPIYAPFVPQERRAVIEESMRESHGAAHMATGVAASRIKSKQKMLLCTKCITDQKSTHGEGYWDRRWLVPLLKYCPQHGALSDTNIELNGDHRHAFLVVSEANVIGKMRVTVRF